MRRVVAAIAALILVVMLAVTVWASRSVGLFDAWPGFRANPWAIATLVDAYSGFLLFYLYVAWRERSLVARAAWFVLIMGLGNMATAAYLLIQIARLGAGEPTAAILGPRR